MTHDENVGATAGRRWLFRCVRAAFRLITDAGYRSRFGHPHPEALARYAAIGARVLDSPAEGMILC